MLLVVFDEVVDEPVVPPDEVVDELAVDEEAAVVLDVDVADELAVDEEAAVVPDVEPVDVPLPELFDPVLVAAALVLTEA